VPLVRAVLTTAQFTALRARCGLPRGFGNEHKTAIVLDNDQHDAPVLTLPASALTIGTWLDADASAISRAPEEA
jgi:hypothetical protein